MKQIENQNLLQKITCDTLYDKKIFLSIQRDDQLHKLINGNKWRKLKYNLVQMKQCGKTELLTFGGAFSNHIHACAAAGKQFDFVTHGIIRGPQLDPNNPTLRFAQQCNMQLHPVTRLEYKQRHDPDYLAALQKRFPNAYIIPEGGSNEFAIPGCAELAKSLPAHDVVICPTGSGGTLAGLIEGSESTTQVMGVAVLKQAEYLKHEICKISPKAAVQNNWQLLCDFHDGGYGKFTDKLWQFCQNMEKQHNLPLEPIYSGKMMYALWQLIQQGYFAENTRIIAIHTGGLQGLQGLKYRGLI
jgi:1-aminocyclopropane-1-carboxylate deaminase